MNVKQLRTMQNELEKCATAYQAGLFYEIYKFFPETRVEVSYYDSKNKKNWRIDIVVGNIWIELDGMQHRYDDLRFRLDEAKDTFAFENGKYVFRRSNYWWNFNWRKFPQILLLFIYKMGKTNGIPKYPMNYRTLDNFITLCGEKSK